MYSAFFWQTQKKVLRHEKKEAFLSKVHLKVFFFHGAKNDLNVLVDFLPIFHAGWKEKNFYAIVVCGSRRMFTIIWNTLRLEYKRHYANRTYFCHFPS